MAFSDRLMSKKPWRLHLLSCKVESVPSQCSEEWVVEGILDPIEAKLLAWNH
jgi:hypothetical protein